VRSLAAFGDSVHAGSVGEAKRLMATQRWTALFIDVSLPDGSGLDVLEQARAAGVSAPALVLTVNHDASTINRAFDSNARFLVKSGDWSAIEKFVRAALSLESRIDEVAAQWKTRYALSRTEIFILTHSAQGMSREELATEREIMPATLKRHINNLLKKTGDKRLLDATTRLLREVAAS